MATARKKTAREETARRPPLAGLRVIDLTRVLAGPFCAMSLGDMGAEVIKVEEPGKGDDTRGWPPFASGEATYFMSVNRNKKSLTLNMKAPEGQAILRRLLAKADVVIENFRPGTMERLGFGYAALRKLNPRLIYCSISGFGESGPEASRPGYDLIVQGESGVMDLTGFPDGPPVKVGNSIGDLVSGMAAAQGVTLALLSRSKTGKGQKVEIGMLDVMASLLTYQAGLYWNAGGKPARRGNQHPSIVPYEVFQAQDAYMTLGVANNSLWERMCAAIGREDLAKDPRFDTEANRVTNRDALDPAAQRGVRHAAGRGMARAPGQGGRARRAHQDGGRGVRERAPARARHVRDAAASQGGAGHRHGRADPPLGHAGRRPGARAAPRPAHRRDPDLASCACPRRRSTSSAPPASSDATADCGLLLRGIVPLPLAAAAPRAPPRRHADVGTSRDPGRALARSQRHRGVHQPFHGPLRDPRRPGEADAGRRQHAEPRRIVDGVEGRAHVRVRPAKGREVPQRRPGDRGRREVLLRPLQGRGGEAPQGEGAGGPDPRCRAGCASS